ncbi:hypothetical protein BZG36_01823 [Bifiguratus adelaidae]|uniref:Nucleolar protein Dnt1-like N-terminal domain-containing protein n=1 Tax=Bifiguratus adelaidae TaxID=1938954 RepID=A0A261Y297_9FUNG|nr:hypothetical protein BZG36_01823 [Bifiguratus adelaidae]
MRLQVCVSVTEENTAGHEAKDKGRTCLKRFLLLTDGRGHVSNLKKEIEEKWRKLYRHEAPLKTSLLQDADHCDIDDDYQIQDAFEDGATVNVTISQPQRTQLTPPFMYTSKRERDANGDIELIGVTKRTRYGNGNSRLPNTPRYNGVLPPDQINSRTNVYITPERRNDSHIDPVLSGFGTPGNSKRPKNDSDSEHPLEHGNGIQNEIADKHMDEASSRTPSKGTTADKQASKPDLSIVNDKVFENPGQDSDASYLTDDAALSRPNLTSGGSSRAPSPDLPVRKLSTRQEPSTTEDDASADEFEDSASSSTTSEDSDNEDESDGDALRAAGTSSAAFDEFSDLPDSVIPKPPTVVTAHKDEQDKPEQDDEEHEDPGAMNGILSDATAESDDTSDEEERPAQTNKIMNSKYVPVNPPPQHSPSPRTGLSRFPSLSQLAATTTFTRLPSDRSLTSKTTTAEHKRQETVEDDDTTSSSDEDTDGSASSSEDVTAAGKPASKSIKFAQRKRTKKKSGLAALASLF